MPKMAATAKTTACAASSQALDVISTAMSTAVVMSAPNLGPLGSMPMSAPSRGSHRLGGLAAVPGLRQRCLGLSRALLGGREAAIIHDPAPCQASAGRWLHRASQENSYHLYRKFYHRTKCGDHVGFPRLLAGAVRNVPVRPEHKRGRGPPDVEPAHQVQPGLGVDVEVAHAVDHAGHVAEYPPGGPRSEEH